MQTLLITGATGNVGRAVIARLNPAQAHIIAAVRNPERAAEALGERIHATYALDFETGAGLQLPQPVDAVLLVRPPQLADAKRYFEPFISQLDPATRVVFLSVQGADSKPYLPHAKIEALIEQYHLPHTFLRPSYFMENLLTTLYDDMRRDQRIYMPSGDLQFNWIALDDVAEIAVRALMGELDAESVVVSNTREYGFREIVALINAECGAQLRYESPSLLRYVTYELRRGTPLSFVGVMLLLHYLPRFQKRPAISTAFGQYAQREPMDIGTFIRRHKDAWAPTETHAS